MDDQYDLRRLVWDSMLVADLNARYSSCLANRFQRVDKGAKILVAVTSSAVVSGWAIWGQPGVDWIWKAASVAATLVALASPISDWAGSMKTASKLNGGWSSLLREYTFLWAQVDTLPASDLGERYSAIAEKEDPLNDLEVSVQKNPKLVTRCWNDVLVARGLSVPRKEAA